jgi:hypothetical protein
MIERWQIYAVPLGVITPGATKTLLSFQLDNDAPFVLRGRSIGVTETTTVNSPAFVTQLWTRLTDHAEHWSSTDIVNVAVDMPGAGGAGAPGLWYPEKPYPAGSVIQIEVLNDGTANADIPVTATLYLHGVKLMPDGVYAPTYPARCKVYPDSMRLPQTGDELLTLTTNGAGSQVYSYRLGIRGNADYVFRAGMMGWSTAVSERAPATVGFRNLLVTVKDRDQRAYSNTGANLPIQGIPANHILGLPPCGGPLTTVNAFAGDFTPGLFVPELYVRANDALFFDFVRNDGGLGLGTVTPQIVFFGSKVYSK